MLGKGMLEASIYLTTVFSAEKDCCHGNLGTETWGDMPRPTQPVGGMARAKTQSLSS